MLPLENIVIYPFMVAPLQVTGDQSIKLIDDVIQGDKILGLVAQRVPSGDEFDYSNIYTIGTAATVLKMARVPDGSVMILVQGISRIRLLKSVQTKPYLIAEVETASGQPKIGKRAMALMSNLAVQFEKLITMLPHLPEELKIAVSNNNDPDRLADLVASNVRLTLEQRQDLLETLDVEERLDKVTKLLNSELQVTQLGSKIQSQVESQMDKTQRDITCASR